MGLAGPSDYGGGHSGAPTSYLPPNAYLPTASNPTPPPIPGAPPGYKPPTYSAPNAYAPPKATAAAPPQSGVLSGPGYGEDWYKAHGSDLSGPSRSTDLYNQGAAGSNPFYGNAEKMVDQSINDQAAVRGGWNSSSTMNTLGIANADLRGQQAHELGTLAGQADSADTSRFNASAGAAKSAQDSTEGRIQQVTNGYTTLAKNQADLVTSFYSMSAKALESMGAAGIEAQMKAAGVDAAEAQALTNDVLAAAGIVVKATGK